LNHALPAQPSVTDHTVRWCCARKQQAGVAFVAELNKLRCLGGTLGGEFDPLLPNQAATVPVKILTVADTVLAIEVVS